MGLRGGGQDEAVESGLLLYPTFVPAAEAQFQRLQKATRELEAVWSQDFGDEASRLAAITRLSQAVDDNCRFEPEDLSEWLRGCLALEDARAPLRITVTEESGAVRLRAEPGVDLRLLAEGTLLLVQGRRRPAFHLYEYLTSTLGPGRSEESRLESCERVVVRRRDGNGELLDR